MPTVSGVTTRPMRGVVQTVWTNMANTDVGTVLNAPHYPDKTVTVRGTFGAGGTVVLEGTAPGGTTYSTLYGDLGVLSFTAAGVMAILENPGDIRPRVSAGDGTTALTITILAKA